MDLSSIISATAMVIKGVDDYAVSIKDAPKSCESLKAELSSIQEILTELDNLVEVDNGDVRYSALHSTRYVELTSD